MFANSVLGFQGEIYKIDGYIKDDSGGFKRCLLKIVDNDNKSYYYALCTEDNKTKVYIDVRYCEFDSSDIYYTEKFICKGEINLNSCKDSKRGEIIEILIDEIRIFFAWHDINTSKNFIMWKVPKILDFNLYKKDDKYVG